MNRKLNTRINREITFSCLLPFFSLSLSAVSLFVCTENPQITGSYYRRNCQGKNTSERLENGLHFDFNITITIPPSSSTKSTIILKKF